MKKEILILLVLFMISISASPIKVGVVDQTGLGGGQQTINQLNNDSYFDFSASLLSVTQADSFAELANYDVVIIGGSGHGNSGWTDTMASAIRTYVENGGGLIGTGWYIHERKSKSTSIKNDLGAVMPGDPAIGYSYVSGATFTVSGGNHEITNGLSSSFSIDGSYVETNTASLPSGDMLLGYVGSSSGNKSLIIRDDIGTGNGRSVYLGVLYLANVSNYGTTGLASGETDRLLEQTVAWTAGGGGALVNVPETGTWILGLMFIGLVMIRKYKK